MFLRPSLVVNAAHRAPDGELPSSVLDGEIEPAVEGWVLPSENGP
jgi:hypothetical protein